MDVRKRALLLSGGWDGHDPRRTADFAAARVLGDFDVVRSTELGDLCPRVLDGIDLLVPIWTYGELSRECEAALFGAVERGMGVLAWHGATSAFLACRRHKFLLGGQFVAHPGEAAVTYTVRFHDNDPLVAGLADVTLTSEQYYMLIDPAVKVLASTRVVGPGMDWVAGVEMPVAWTRRWGRGRVFYCSIGHTPDDLEHPSLVTLLRRAASWGAEGRTRSNA